MGDDLRQEAALSAVPCCDWRDHADGVCACPDHERSPLHPFGRSCGIEGCEASEDLAVVEAETEEGATRQYICNPHAKEMISEAAGLWGTPGIEIEIEFERAGKVHRIGWDGEATYVPVDLPDDASDEEIFEAMGEAAESLGFGEDDG